jgi:ATP-dependent Lhr-like helicase
MTSPSERFHPLLRHHLVNTLGWRELRPLQELAAEPILEGAHALILAPTAGGKTEAAILPVISRLIEEDWRGTAILYLCPLKALLNNLHQRLETYFGMVGHQVGLWHGDTTTADRRKIESTHPACLMTTPESLEVMLISARNEPRHLLKDIRVVIVDEIHAFAGDDRGTHLLAVVERISQLAGREIQRLGLSATVGNPDELLSWLAGHCAGTKKTVTISAAAASAEVTLDYVGSLDNAALVISRLHQGEKRLVFCDSRRRVEELAVSLKGLGIQVFVSHSSISLEQRREAEHAFQEGENCVIVSTSTLELGIDVGDLDRVIQIDAPATVASFLQRIGRTGRRRGTIRNCLFLATTPEALLHAAAIIGLWESGYVEPIRAPQEPMHLFAQQLLALSLQNRGIARDGWKAAIGRIAAYGGIEEIDSNAVIEHLINQELLTYDGVWLSMGNEGEKHFGRRHFLELISVFTSSPSFEVMHGTRAVGSLDWLAIAQGEGEKRQPIILAGRSWDIQTIEWKTRRIFVTPSESRGKVRWHGLRRGLSFAVTQRIRVLLLGEAASPRWSSRAKDQMKEQREALGPLAEQCGRIWHDANVDRIRWTTFAGATVNGLLGSILKGRLSIEVSWDDFELSLPRSADVLAIRNLAAELLSSTAPLVDAIPLDEDVLEQLKFSVCLPKSLAHRAAHGRQDMSQLRGVLISAASVPLPE